MHESIANSMSRMGIPECHELKKALHELAVKGQIRRFLKKGLRFFRREREPTQL